MAQAQTFMSASLAPNSQSTYKSAWKSYLNFCIGHGLQPLPATERNLILYFTHAAIRNIAHSSMTVYLSGLRHHCRLLGHDINIDNMNCLYHLLRGIRRTQGNSLTRPIRQPIKLPSFQTTLLRGTTFQGSRRQYVMVCVYSGILWFITLVRIYKSWG